MAAIVCFGCGMVFDSGVASCPRCGRCPQCGCPRPGTDEPCPDCDFSGNESEIGELETRCRADLPGNQKFARELEQDWQHEQLPGRIRYWRLLAVLVPLVPVQLLLADCLRRLAGLSDSSTMGFFMLLYLFSYHLLLRLVVKHRFHWLLRDEPPKG